MIVKIPIAVLLSLASVTSRAQDLTRPPADAVVRYSTQGVGVQIYACTAKDGNYVWALQEPQADLLDAKTFSPLGTHSKGPTWTWSDGSSITGKVLQQQPSPDAAANIPWLLLQTQSSGGNGALNDIAYVRRSDTDGGVAAKTGCNAQLVGATAKIPYKATYTFYSKSK
jgi:hypothetical protein